MYQRLFSVLQYGYVGDWSVVEQGCPSIRGPGVRSPAPLVHVDVSLGKTLSINFNSVYFV